jgi:putative ABC transport system permease protein
MKIRTVKQLNMGLILNNLRRSLKRNRGFLLINIAGLSIGLAVSLVLMLFVVTELSYDRHFENNDRIVALNTVWIESGKRTVFSINTRKAYTEIPSRIPGIEKAVQIYRGFDAEILKDKQRFQKNALLYADPELFDVFKMEFVSGNPSLALKEPNSAAITDKFAHKLFGSLDAMGKTFSIDGQTFTVTAVVKELPQNTHFSFDLIASMKSVGYLDQMGGLEFQTYYLLKPNISQTDVCREINKANVSILSEGFKDFNSEFDSETISLTDIYLHSKGDSDLGARGSIESVLILAGLALLILLLAITNFVNLFVVQGDSRASEVGVRKVNGAGNKDIALQFFAEASVIVLLAFFIAIGLADAFIKPFSDLIDKEIEPSLIFSPLFLAGIMFLILFTVFLSASYPAFYLSRFKPIEVLKKTRTSSKRRFTISVTIFQSAITIILISVILIINLQIKFLTGLPKGYNTENVMVVTGINRDLVSHYESIRQNLQNMSAIQTVSAAAHIVGGGCSGQGIYLFGDQDKTSQSINEYRVFPGLCELMKFELVEGKFFTENNPLNRSSMVINEAAARMLGIADSAAGRKAVMFEEPWEIIGVVKDFYYDSPKKKVEPIALTCYNRYQSLLYIRFNSTVKKNEATQMILPVFRQFDPDFVLNPMWCDDIYGKKFDQERSLSKVVTASTVLSLIIALLGLFAIHFYSASRRTKEIGVRKVMGESAWSIIWRLSADVIKWIAVAGVIAVPVSVYIARTWLANYANHTTIGLLPLLLPVVLQLLFAILATIIVSARASSGNPVDALRYE